MAAADYNLRQLSSFVVAAEQLSSGSRQGPVVFAQLEAQLVSLEEQIGVALFDRSGRPKLSAAGEALLPHVRAALGSIDEGIGKARSA